MSILNKNKQGLTNYDKHTPLKMTNFNESNLWKLAGCIATFFIVLSIPVYYLKTGGLLKDVHSSPALVSSNFVGSQKCGECHRREHQLWNNSHHDKAMDIASPETVLGNFQNSTFNYFGFTSRFYRKQGKFFVYTQGPGGQPGEFEITHTFGWYPLQQYLIPFPGGRLQCLPIAWDVRKKRWFHLNPEKPIDPKDWLYWTRSSQNWNGMCAECHSTNLKKNYNFKSDTYQTTWSDIDVGCEACHGPGSSHVEWAQLPAMARPQTKSYELVVETNSLNSRQQIELCAPCHARRSSLSDNSHRFGDFMDYAVPQLLREEYYFADGQIQEEVYVYASFMQSKMYARNIRCSDCHNVHSTKRIKEGNDLCLQCHKAAVYNTKDHHYHKNFKEKGDPIRSKSGDILFDVGTGAQCEQCHMPGRNYMVIDYRPDHSFRIPRPDLSLSIQTPNACNRCHLDKSNQWSRDHLKNWYGQKKRPHYGTVLAAGRKRKPEAVAALTRLANDRLYPAIARATALSLLSTYPNHKSVLATIPALTDEEPIVRHTATRHLSETDPAKRAALLAPLLYDPIKAVRIEAARSLSAIPSRAIPESIRKKFESVLLEYIRAMEHTGDFAASRHNLGNLYTNLGEKNLAIEQYKKAIEIDKQFYPAKINLAMLYNRMGKNRLAEKLFRQVVQSQPTLYEPKYSLGLLLAEMKNFVASVVFLRQAAIGMPNHPRVHYNLGLLQQQLGKDTEAENSLRKALELRPDNIDFMLALADYYLKRHRWKAAQKIAARMISTYPDQRTGHDILAFIKRKTEG